MAVSLVTNVQVFLKVLSHTAHCWLGSTVALYWINGRGEYRQIQQHEQVNCHHVPTEENPADLGSRERDAVNNHLWKHGPIWLCDRSNWPPDILLGPSPETIEEAKVKQEIFSIAIHKHNVLDQELSSHA